jgi:hypothetical protein
MTTKPLGPERENQVILTLKRGVGVLALVSGIIASASVNHAHAADDKMSEARAASTHTCSVLGYKSAKEYNSSTWPWYTYSTCMTEYGQKP